MDSKKALSLEFGQTSAPDTFLADEEMGVRKVCFRGSGVVFLRLDCLRGYQIVDPVLLV
jgi:hypothetical protein